MKYLNRKQIKIKIWCFSYFNADWTPLTIQSHTNNGNSMLVFSMGMLVTTCKIQCTYLGFSCHNISTTTQRRWTYNFVNILDLVILNASHLIYGLLTNMYGDLAHKAKKHNMFSSFMRVKLKQQTTLPWEAPSPTIVLNVFNFELTLASFDPIITIGITYTFILATLSIGLVVDYPSSLILAYNEFPECLVKHNKQRKGWW